MTEPKETLVETNTEGEPEELMRDFLASMPEVTVDKNSDEWKIVQECYGGDARKYILSSFENFLEQTVYE